MQIIDIARSYVGQREKPGNTGFLDKQLEADMRSVGWVPGHSWCAYFIEMVAWKAYPDRVESIKGLFVPSAVNSYRNLLRAGYKSSMEPKVGSFMFMQKMNDSIALWQGHCGIVSHVTDSKNFRCIEGNTNSAGSREGDSVQEKSRVVNPNVENGLKIIGFVEIRD